MEDDDTQDHDFWECYWLIPTPRSRASLRRYRLNPSKCLGDPNTYCNAQVPLVVVEGKCVSGDLWPHNDPRWPTLCATCGMPFHDDDPWMLFHEDFFLISGTTTEVTKSEAAPGAIWDAAWLDGHRPSGPDGLWVTIKLPDGVEWFVDRLGDNGKPIWERTGVLPYITINPSVKTKRGAWSVTEGRLTRNRG